MNSYVDGTTEMKEIAQEKIDEYITDCIDNTDTEAVLKNIRKLNLYNLNETEIIDTKKRLLKYINIPKLEEKSKQAILNLSGIGQVVAITDTEHIKLDNKTRLNTIYEIVSNLESVKTKTTNLRKYSSNGNNDYDYILNYLIITQQLLNSIYDYTDLKVNEQTATSRSMNKSNPKLLAFNQ